MSTAPGPFVHDKALCESDDVGPRTRIWPFAHVMKGARVGADCNVCGHAFVESGAVIGNQVTIKNGVMIWDGVNVEDGVFLGPGMVFTNDATPRAERRKDRSQWLPTRVSRGATIGANATILCGITIGRYAFVAAGAVVTRDVPAHALMVGVPARRAGWACECGETLPASLRCGCGLGYRLVDETSGLERVARA